MYVYNFNSDAQICQISSKITHNLCVIFWKFFLFSTNITTTLRIWTKKLVENTMCKFYLGGGGQKWTSFLREVCQKRTFYDKGGGAQKSWKSDVVFYDRPRIRPRNSVQQEKNNLILNFRWHKHTESLVSTHVQILDFKLDRRTK